MRIRTALVTARSAPAHERAIRTLMDWRIEVDEALFLGGLPGGHPNSPTHGHFKLPHLS
jgi:5'-nucleotidase